MLDPRCSYRQSGTLRVAVFRFGAVLGVMGRDDVVKLPTVWGGLRKHKPLVDANRQLRRIAVHPVQFHPKDGYPSEAA